VAEFLSRLRGVRDVDLVIANGENAASGMGLTDAVVRELFESGVDVLTGGNHVWDKKEGSRWCAPESGSCVRRTTRPGWTGGDGAFFRGRSGTPYAVVSLIGRCLSWEVTTARSAGPTRRSPGSAARRPALWVDFHAEATSEKRALALYLDGGFPRSWERTRTFQTSDASVLRGAPLHHRRGDVRPRRVDHRDGSEDGPPALPPPGARPLRCRFGRAGGVGVFLRSGSGNGAQQSGAGVPGLRIANEEQRDMENVLQSLRRGTVEVISGRAFPESRRVREGRSAPCGSRQDSTRRRPTSTWGTRC